AEGTEDYIALDRARDEAAVHYTIELSEDVAGLRLVARTLELLDANGAPRLRMAPPYLVDAEGQRHEASLAVRGCDFDDNPAPPWQRRVTAPRARACSLQIEWDDHDVSYPALLD